VSRQTRRPTASRRGEPSRATVAETDTARDQIPYIAADLQLLAVEVATLNPAPNNARRHVLDKDVPVLAESLRRYGQRKPIVAKRAYMGVVNAVLAGNGTILAAQSLGWTHIAVAWVPDEWTDEHAQEYALLDNRTAELSEWDLQELGSQLGAIQARGGNLEELGWQPHEAAPLVAARWAPSEAAANAGLPGREVHYRSVSLSLGQWLVLELAVQRAQQRANDPEMTEGRALELMAAEFLGTPDTSDLWLDNQHPSTTAPPAAS
jgi:hypothetical protein